MSAALSFSVFSESLQPEKSSVIIVNATNDSLSFVFCFKTAGAYFESFKDFTGQVVPDQPFCFWFGSYNPHRGYEEGSGRQVGVDISKISLPKVYPESDVVRSDMADYLKEV